MGFCLRVLDHNKLLDQITSETQLLGLSGYFFVLFIPLIRMLRAVVYKSSIFFFTIVYKIVLLADAGPLLMCLTNQQALTSFGPFPVHICLPLLEG